MATFMEAGYITLVTMSNKLKLFVLGHLLISRSLDIFQKIGQSPHGEAIRRDR